jgi:general secretion pathway protein K
MKHRSPSRQKGVAVVMALLIVTIATLAVSGMLWRQQVQLRAVENRIALAQARSLAQSAIDWARLVLWEDQNLPGRAAYDHPNESWAVPLAETRVADSEGNDSREAFVSGRIRDESGKLNALDLVQSGRVNERVVSEFERLAEALELEPRLAGALAEALLQTQEQPALETGGKTQPAVALPPVVWEDLAQLAGLSAEQSERLSAHVAILPKRNNAQSTPINANSASAEVLYARIDALSLAQTRALVAFRDKVELRNNGDIETATRVEGLSAKLAGVDVKSQYFRIEGRVRYARALTAVEALVWRAPASQDKPHLLWLREL